MTKYGRPSAEPGVDLVTEVPAVADWLAGQPGTLVLGSYVYADGATNVLVSMAVGSLVIGSAMPMMCTTSSAG